MNALHSESFGAEVSAAAGASANLDTDIDGVVAYIGSCIDHDHQFDCASQCGNFSSLVDSPFSSSVMSPCKHCVVPGFPHCFKETTKS